MRSLRAFRSSARPVTSARVSVMAGPFGVPWQRGEALGLPRIWTASGPMIAPRRFVPWPRDDRGGRGERGGATQLAAMASVVTDAGPGIARVIGAARPDGDPRRLTSLEAPPTTTTWVGATSPAGVPRIRSPGSRPIVGVADPPGPIVVCRALVLRLRATSIRPTSRPKGVAAVEAGLGRPDVASSETRADRSDCCGRPPRSRQPIGEVRHDGRTLRLWPRPPRPMVVDRWRGGEPSGHWKRVDGRQRITVQARLHDALHLHGHLTSAAWPSLPGYTRGR